MSFRNIDWSNGMDEHTPSTSIDNVLTLAYVLLLRLVMGEVVEIVDPDIF